MSVLQIAVSFAVDTTCQLIWPSQLFSRRIDDRFSDWLARVERHPRRLPRMRPLAGLLVTPVNRDAPEAAVIGEAASALRRGELVAFPTETGEGVAGVDWRF